VLDIVVDRDFKSVCVVCVRVLIMKCCLLLSFDYLVLWSVGNLLCSTTCWRTVPEDF